MMTLVARTAASCSIAALATFVVAVHERGPSQDSPHHPQHVAVQDPLPGRDPPSPNVRARSPVPSASFAQQTGNEPPPFYDERVVPAFVDGQAVGLKVLSIRPGTQLARASFKDGDIMNAVDGVALTSGAALEVYAGMKEGRALHIVDVTRRGEHVALTIAPSGHPR